MFLKLQHSSARKRYTVCKYSNDFAKCTRMDVEMSSLHFRTFEVQRDTIV
jgi:hypothetical protein